MHLIAVAWMYVVLMMAVTEALSTTGTVLGALITFMLYGVLPLALVLYILGTPGRKRRLKAKEAADAAAPSTAPDGGEHAAGDAVAPVREEP
jgi:hypothetical protein